MNISKRGYHLIFVLFFLFSITASYVVKADKTESTYNIVLKEIGKQYGEDFLKDIYKSIKGQTLKAIDLPFMKDIKWPPPIRRIIESLSIGDIEFKKLKTGFSLSGKATVLGVTEVVKFKTLKNKEGKTVGSLLVGLPDGWKFSDIMKIINPNIGQDLSKFEIIHFSKLAFVASDQDYIDEEWGKIENGVNIIGSLKTAGVIKYLDRMFGGQLSKAQLDFRGVLKPPRGIGSLFNVKIPVGFTMVKDIFGLEPAELQVTIEEDITQAPKPAFMMKGGIWLGIPIAYTEPLKLQKVAFSGIFKLMPNQFETYLQSQGDIPNAFGIKGFTISDCSVGALWNLAVMAEKLAAVVTVVGAGLAVLPTGFAMSGSWGLNKSKVQLGIKAGIGEKGLEDVAIMGKGTVRLRDVVDFWLDKVETIAALFKKGFDRKNILKEIPDIKIEDAEFYFNPKETTIGTQRFPKMFKIRAGNLAILPKYPARFEFVLSEDGVDAYGALLREIRIPEKNPVIVIGRSGFNKKEKKVAMAKNIDLTAKKVQSKKEVQRQAKEIGEVLAGDPKAWAQGVKGPIAEIHINAKDPRIFVDGLVSLNLFGNLKTEAKVDISKNGFTVNTRDKIYDVYKSNIEIKAQVPSSFSVKAQMTSEGIHEFTKKIIDTGNKLINATRKNLEMAKAKALSDIRKWEQSAKTGTQQKIDDLTKKIKMQEKACNDKFPGFWKAIPRAGCHTVMVGPLKVSLLALKAHKNVTLTVAGGVAQGYTNFALDTAKIVNEAVDKVLSPFEKVFLKIAKFTGEVIDITKLEIQTNDKDLKRGMLPRVTIEGSILKQPFKLNDIQVDLRDPISILEAIVKTTSAFN